MAKVQNMGIVDLSFKAGADLSASTNQYLWVSLAAASADTVVLSTGTSNPAALGILQNSPCLGEEARVRVFGPSKMKIDTSASAIGRGTYVHSASNGKTIHRVGIGASSMAQGFALETASADGTIQGFVLPMTTYIGGAY